LDLFVGAQDVMMSSNYGKPSSIMMSSTKIPNFPTFKKLKLQDFLHL